MAKQDFYALLGVERDASNAAMDTAYQAACAALQQRPKGQGDDLENRLKFLRFARETLLNEGRRGAYDASLRQSAPRTPAAPAPRASPAVAYTLAALVLVCAIFGLARKLRTPAPAIAAPAVAVPLALPVAAPSAAAPVPQALSTEELFERNAQSVAVIAGLNGAGQPMLQGSGVVVANERVITNCHVAKSAASTVVHLGGKAHPATLLRVDPNPQHDLCLLAVDGLRAPAIVLAEIASLKVGNKVFALGAPKGLELTLSEGIVSSLRTYDDSHFIQTTASISPGSSGGGLFDAHGALVGITTFQSTEGQNLNFAVPVDWVRTVVGRVDTLAVLGPSALTDLQGSWRCASSGDTPDIVYHFRSDGSFTMARAENANIAVKGSYAISGNHTLVLKNPNAEPSEVYAQIMALRRTDLQISSPFYQDAQTYQCRKR